MKKLLLPICIIALLALVLTAVSGKLKTPGDEAPGVTTVSEAAFSMRTSGAADASSRLVGNFIDESGIKLCFDGAGQVKRVLQNLSAIEGRYTLLQSTDGAAILDMDLGDGQQLYSFALSSPEGAFTLTDGSGATQTYTPVI